MIEAFQAKLAPEKAFSGLQHTEFHRCSRGCGVWPENLTPGSEYRPYQAVKIRVWSLLHLCKLKTIEVGS